MYIYSYICICTYLSHRRSSFDYPTAFCAIHYCANPTNCRLSPRRPLSKTDTLRLAGQWHAQHGLYSNVYLNVNMWYRCRGKHANVFFWSTTNMTTRPMLVYNLNVKNGQNENEMRSLHMSPFAYIDEATSPLVHTCTHFYRYLFKCKDIPNNWHVKHDSCTCVTRLVQMFHCCASVYMCACVYVCMYRWILFIYERVRAYMYAYTCVCAYLNHCVCMHVHIHTYMYTFSCVY